MDRHDSPPASLAFACALVGPDFARRLEVIRTELFVGVDHVADLPDGLAVRFSDAEGWAERALAFINFERTCCPFLGFELAFEPDGGPLWLRIRGADDAKAFIRSELAGLLPNTAR